MGTREITFCLKKQIPPAAEFYDICVYGVYGVYVDVLSVQSTHLLSVQTADMLCTDSL